jgi:triosephosphate isomerase
MRRPFLAANWKMNKTVDDCRSFMDVFAPLICDEKDADIVIAPPFTALYAMSGLLKDAHVKLAAQNMFHEEKGAFTGEISPAMLTDVGCEYVILGHSERRVIFRETDEVINKKIIAARNFGLDVIFCIGETLAEREAGKTLEVLKRQLAEGLKSVPYDGIVVAYEPVWAIGTGKTATTAEAQEAHEFIRVRLSGMYGDAAAGIRILYGGSVTPDNIAALMACPDVDGALVGGAGLKPDSFAKIVKYNK